jgi:membrane-associated protease RseP (regulator of RpoE activity)
MMRVINGAGMRRLANPYSLLAFSLSAPAAVIAAQQSGPATPRVQVMARAKADTTVLDSAATARKREMIVAIKKVDSLVRLLNEMPIGSPEYRRINEEVRATTLGMLPGGVTVFRSDSNTSFAIAPTASAVRARTALEAPRILVDATPRGLLGFSADGFSVQWVDVDGTHVRYYEYPTVVSVSPNSPASKVGLQFGDSILAYNGQDLLRTEINLTRLLEPGRKVTVKVRQEGETKELSINVVQASMQEMLVRRAANAGSLMAARAPVAPDGSDRPVLAARKAFGGGVRGGSPYPRAAMMVEIPAGLLGARMTDVDSAAAVNLTQRKTTHGVLVIGIEAGSPADRIGILSGDLIIAVGDADVGSLSQLSREVNARGANRPIQFSVLRRDAKGDLKTERLTYDPHD